MRTTKYLRYVSAVRVRYNADDLIPQDANDRDWPSFDMLQTTHHSSSCRRLSVYLSYVIYDMIDTTPISLRSLSSVPVAGYRVVYLGRKTSITLRSKTSFGGAGQYMTSLGVVKSTLCSTVVRKVPRTAITS